MAGANTPLEQLTQARPDRPLRFDAVLLEGDKTTSPMQLRAVSPWTPDAVIVVHGESGERQLAPPMARFFRGALEHEPGSRVMLRIDAAGAIKGLILSGGGAWMLDAADAKDLGALSAKALHLEDWHEKPTRFSCSALEAPAQAAAPFVDKRTLAGGSASPDTRLPAVLHELLGPAAAKGAVTHMARVAVDTDHEYFQLFGNSSDAAQYMADLFAFISGIYEDEVQTALAISRLDLYDTPADPWTQTETDCALYEVGQLWNTQRSDIDRTITHFVSGKQMGGGIAWLGVLCSNPAGGATNIGNSCPGLPSTGQYFGGYGVSGGLFGTFNPGNPGVVWDLVVIAHEIGHNFDSPHTHCYGGIGGNANPVDQCATESGTGCFTGTPSLPGPLGQRSGTIMSYCHLLTGGLSNIESTFGAGHAFGTLPERVPAQMRQHVLDRAAGNAACLAPQSGLRLVATPAQRTVCVASATDSALFDIAAEGFGSSASLPVTLTFPAPLPAGFSLQSLSPNPVTPGSSAALGLQVAAGTSAGDYSLTLQGSNGQTSNSVNLDVRVESAPTASPTLTSPAADASDVVVRPSFSWQAVSGATGYRIEIADNPDFTDPLVSQDVANTSFTPTQPLQFGTRYHWRVASLGSCGSSGFSAARSFTVAVAVGQCPAGQSTQLLLQEDFEASAPGWAQSAAVGSGGWGFSSARAASGSRSALSPGNNAISDRRLISPPIQLPTGLSGLGLRFATFVDIEFDPSVCWDSARLEVSTDGGASFTGVPTSAIQNRPYDAVVAGNYGNPLGGRLAWCGARASFETYTVDLSAWAGQTVNLGFRSTSDSSINREGWYIDDVSVIGCAEIDDSRIFEDGFEQLTPP